MDTAVVTGASSGIGLAVARTLVDRGYRVFGLARHFDTCDFRTEAFVQTLCDIRDTGHLLEVLKTIQRETDNLGVLVNNAGIGWFGPHDTLSPTQIEAMVQTNLLAPMVITRTLLPRLRDSRGIVINVASTAAVTPHRFGGAYAATKAGLLQFGESLFHEVRRAGVRVTTLLPDMTDTQFHDNADFAPDNNPLCHLTADCVADTVAFVLDRREGTVPTQITLKPQMVGIQKK